MPTRSDFFAAGPANIEPGTLCGICSQDMQSRHPVRLICNDKHTFCRECITPHVQRNRCVYDCTIRPFDPAPWTDVDQTIIDSVAAKLVDTNLHHPCVEELGGHRAMDWHTYLSKRMEPEINGVPVISYEKSFAAIKGSGQLVPEQLLLSTMTLCNAIPRLVAYSSEKENYDDYELQHWQLISEALIAVLPTCEAKVDHVEVLPNVLRQKIESGLSSEDMGPSPFLQKGSARSEDLNLLLEYLAATAFLAGVPPERVSLSLGPALRIAKFVHDFVQH